MNRENLDKLATYLESLPADYEHFDMSRYLLIPGGIGSIAAELAYGADPTILNNCGTAACALGHGPAAGIPAELEPGYGIDWDQYAEENFTEDGNVHDWLFSSFWDGVDDTHQGAAARIRYILDGNEVPERLIRLLIEDEDGEIRQLYAGYLK
jgi:hypothetical protein